MFEKPLTKKRTPRKQNSIRIKKRTQNASAKAIENETQEALRENISNDGSETFEADEDSEQGALRPTFTRRYTPRTRRAASRKRSIPIRTPTGERELVEILGREKLGQFANQIRQNLKSHYKQKFANKASEIIDHYVAKKKKKIRKKKAQKSVPAGCIEVENALL